MKDKTFEEFLQEWHAKDYHGTDDAMPDAFDAWLGDLEVDTLMRLADIFAGESYLVGVKRAQEITLEVLSSK